MKFRREWVYLTKEAAESHPLYGVRGWLLGFLISFCVGGLLLAGLVAWRIIAPSRIVAVDRHFVMVGIALASLWVVFLAVPRSKQFAGWSIAMMAATAVAAIITADAGRPPGYHYNILVIIYLVRSRRVNVTMKWRVRANDPFLQQPPEAFRTDDEDEALQKAGEPNASTESPALPSNNRSKSGLKGLLFRG